MGCLGSKITNTPASLRVIWNCGDYLTSLGGMFFAMLQSNGQIGIYYGSDPDPQGNNILLTTVGTADTGSGYGAFLESGVFYVVGIGPGWAVGTFDDNTTSVTIQDDGQFVISDDTTRATIFTSSTSDTLSGMANVSNMVWDLKNATVVPGNPVAIFTTTAINNTGKEQNPDVVGTGNVDETESWENSVSVATTVKTTFQTGIPLLVKGEVEISVTASYAYTWGGSQTTSIGYQINGAVSLDPYSAVEIVAVVSISEISLPYTAIADLTFSNKGTLLNRKIRGTYTGTNSHDVKISYNPTPYPPSADHLSGARELALPNFTVTKKELADASAMFQ